MSSRNAKPADLNRRAAAVVAEATGQVPDDEAKKNPQAVIRGRLGGTTRAFRLSAGRRREIAKEAVKARWDAAEGKEGV